MKVKTFWCESQNAMRTQIHVAIITHCIIGIIEYDLKFSYPIMLVVRIPGCALLLKEDIKELFGNKHMDVPDTPNRELSLNFAFN